MGKQSLVDKGVFRRVGTCPTPWPCFVVAARMESLKTHRDEIKTILEIINRITIDFKNIADIDKVIANRYHQKIEDVQAWLSLTEWSQDLISEETIHKVQDQLLALNIIPKKLNYSDLVTQI